MLWNHQDKWLLPQAILISGMSILHWISKERSCKTYKWINHILHSIIRWMMPLRGALGINRLHCRQPRWVIAGLPFFKYRRLGLRVKIISIKHGILIYSKKRNQWNMLLKTIKDLQQGLIERIQIML